MSSQGQYLRLETMGRKSGKLHKVILRFVTYDGKIVMFPEQAGRQDWVANTISNPNVKVFTDGVMMDGIAKVKVTKDVRDPILGVFSRKYGKSVIRNRYWGQTTYVEVQPLRRFVVQQFRELVYDDLEAAFDGVARDYDKHIFGNPINLWLRNRSVSLMARLFKPGDTILEIGCGTGTETLSLARRGIRVLACDVSSRMLQVLTKKSEAAGLREMIVPIHSRPYLLKSMLGEMGYSGLDGAYSTYGAINTEPDLGGLFADLHSMIKPNGILLLGVWNRYCLYEILGYSMRLKFPMAVGRFRNPVPVGKSRFCISSNAYSVSSLNRIISKYFKLSKVRGVGIFLPPSNLVKYLPPPPFLNAVKRIDLLLEAQYPWSHLGDHFLGVYVRNG